MGIFIVRVSGGLAGLSQQSLVVGLLTDLDLETQEGITVCSTAATDISFLLADF